MMTVDSNETLNSKYYIGGEQTILSFFFHTTCNGLDPASRTYTTLRRLRPLTGSPKRQSPQVVAGFVLGVPQNGESNEPPQMASLDLGLGLFSGSSKKHRMESGSGSAAPTPPLLRRQRRSLSLQTWGEFDKDRRTNDKSFMVLEAGSHMLMERHRGTVTIFSPAFKYIDLIWPRLK